MDETVRSAARRQSAVVGPDSDSTGSTDLDSEDTAAIISDLINQGAAVNATTDRTGQWALELWHRRLGFFEIQPPVYRALYGGLGAQPPAGSRGRAPG